MTTLDQLRAFVVVAEQKNFTRAAEVMYLTQPAVSSAIAVLESRYRVKLLCRHGRQVELTAAGTLLLQHARTVLQQVASTEQALQELAGIKHRELELGISPTVAHSWLPSLLSRFRHVNPELKLKLIVNNTACLIEMLLEGKLEFCLTEGKCLDASLQKSVVGMAQLVLVVGQEHPWWSRQQIEVQEVTQTAWYLCEPGCNSRELFHDFLCEQGIRVQSLNVALEVPSPTLLKATVGQGCGAAILSCLLVKDELEAGRLRSICIREVTMPSQTFSLFQHKKYHCSRVCQEFIALLQDENYRPI